MAFWGIEVKSGRPVTHSFDRVKGRLRISQATLGIGSSPTKSLVQCNVGFKSPILLCSLLPDKIESSHLDLEFEEADEVVFSVIGPRSVFLSGYYVGNCRHLNLDDDTDSYGEDIANTDTEQSIRSDEDEYEDSFIDDDEPEVLPDSPVSSDGVHEEMLGNKARDRKRGRKRLKKKYQSAGSIQADDEEMLGNNKTQDKKRGWKRLKKKYQSVGSDDDAGSIEADDEEFLGNKVQDKKRGRKPLKKKYQSVGSSDDGSSSKDNVVNDTTCLTDSEDEDNYLLSVFKKNRTANHMTPKAGEKANKVTVKAGNMKIEDVNEAKGEAEDDVVLRNETGRKEDLPINHLHSSDEVCPNNGIDPKKKKKKGPYKEGKTLEDDIINQDNALKETKSQQDEANNISQDLLIMSNEKCQKLATDKVSDLPCNSLILSSELGLENGMKLKKKKKKGSKEVKNIGADSGNHSDACKEDKTQKVVVEIDNMEQTMRNEHDQEEQATWENDFKSLLPCGKVGSGNGPKTKKRRKKRGKSLEVNSENCSNFLEEKNQANVKDDTTTEDL